MLGPESTKCCNLISARRFFCTQKFCLENSLAILPVQKCGVDSIIQIKKIVLYLNPIRETIVDITSCACTELIFLDE